MFDVNRLFSSRAGDLSQWGEHPIADLMSRREAAGWMIKVLLRHKGKGLYYASGSRWLSDLSQALDLDEVEHVGQLIFEEGVSEVEVVLRNGNSNWELALPVRLGRDRGQPARMAA